MRGAWVLAAALVASPLAAQQQDYSTIGIDAGFSALRGNTECRSDLELAFAVSGIVMEVTVDEGDSVGQGDIIAQLDQRLEEIELERRVVLARDRSDLQSALAQRDVSLAQWEAAQQLFDRRGAISREDVQNRRLAADLAVAEVARLEAQEALEDLDVRAAEAALDRRTLRAPSLGVVSEVLKHSGESVQAYEPVLTLCDLSEVRFVANVPAFGGPALAQGDVVELRFAGEPQPVAGVVRFISLIVDPASGLREVKIDLPDAPGWVRPGLRADLRIAP